MELTQGSVEIINQSSGLSDGIVVNTPDVDSIPAALGTLRGLGGFEVVDPIPLVEREIGSFIYKQVEEGEFVREYRVELVQEPIADAVWRATTADGETVDVYFRESRVLTPDQMEAARVLSELQAMRRAGQS